MSETLVVSPSGSLPSQPWNGNRLVTIVARLVGLASDTTLRAGVLDLINLAIQEFDTYDWSFREQTAANITVAASMATYTLPSDFKRIYDVRLVTNNERTLFPLDRRSYDRLIQGEQGTASIPTHYHLYGSYSGSTITLIPIPSVSDTLRVRYYRTMPMIQDTNANDLNIPFRALVPIIYKSAALMTAWKKPEESNLWEQKYAVALARLIADDRATGDDIEGFMPQVEWATRKTDYVNPDDLSFYPR